MISRFLHALSAAETDPAQLRPPPSEVELDWWRAEFKRLARRTFARFAIPQMLTWFVIFDIRNPHSVAINLLHATMVWAVAGVAQAYVTVKPRFVPELRKKRLRDALDRDITGIPSLPSVSAAPSNAAGTR